MSELAKRIWALTALLCLGIGPAEFPVTAYSGIGHPEHFYEIASGPMTGLVAYAQHTAPVATARYLNAARQTRKCAYLQIPTTIVDDLDAVRSHVRSIRQHTGLCGYYAFDEPNVRRQLSPGAAISLYRAIKREDPSRPVLMAIARQPDFKTADCSTYGSAMDVCMWGWYPFTVDRPAPDVARYQEWRGVFEEMRRSAGSLEFWPIFQCVGNGNPDQPSWKVRWPSAPEMHTQVVSSIPESDGVGCFAWFEANQSWSPGPGRWSWIREVLYPALKEGLRERPRKPGAESPSAPEQPGP